MGRFLRRGLALALITSAICFSYSGPAVSQEGIGEQLGERFDRGISRLGEEVREGWASLRESINNMGVQARVYSRLRWDKDLAGAKLEVDDVEDDDTGGAVVVRGEVDDDAAKEKAIKLAKDTVGVKRVVDAIKVVDTNP